MIGGLMYTKELTQPHKTQCLDRQTGCGTLWGQRQHASPTRTRAKWARWDLHFRGRQGSGRARCQRSGGWQWPPRLQPCSNAGRAFWIHAWVLL